MSVQILVVDDQELVRTGLVMMLNAQTDLQVVGQASDGAEAVRRAQELRPDVVLMDLRMPGMDGVEATRRINEFSDAYGIRVLVLTTFDDDESVYESLRAGASGFILKDVPPAELAQAVRLVASGDAMLAPSVTRAVIERFVSLRPADAELQRRAETLSDREQEVLRTVGQGLTNAQIAGRLFVAEATVKSHVSHILTKLGARDRAQAVAIAYEAGLLQVGSLDP